MNVVYKTKKVHLASIKIGQTFEYEGLIYMRIKDDDYDAIILSGKNAGNKASFWSNLSIQPVEFELREV